MQTESFFSHFRRRRFVYFIILCFGALAAMTLFQLTEPKSTLPRLLLIRSGGDVPALPYDAEIAYADSQDSPSPEIVQAYVLMTGAGGFDLFCAPEFLIPELLEQQLIQPLQTDAADVLRTADGQPAALPLSGGYALCLAHHARDSAADRLLQLYSEFSSRP